MDTYKMTHVGQHAPDFMAKSTSGSVDFPADFAGKWVVLYIYIGDFMPCCMSDIFALSNAAPRLKAYNTEILALSPDTVQTHIAWVFSLRNLNKGNNINIDLASDRSLEIAKMYGVKNVSDNTEQTEKTVIIIDQSGVIQAMHTFPYSTGINVTELERELLALQTAKYQYGITPSGWTPGDDVMEYPPQTLNTAGSNVSERTASGQRCVDWYICYRRDTGIRKSSYVSHKEAQSELENKQ